MGRSSCSSSLSFPLVNMDFYQWLIPIWRIIPIYHSYLTTPLLPGISLPWQLAPPWTISRRPLTRQRCVSKVVDRSRMTSQLSQVRLLKTSSLSRRSSFENSFSVLCTFGCLTLVNRQKLEFFCHFTRKQLKNGFVFGGFKVKTWDDRSMNLQIFHFQQKNVRTALYFCAHLAASCKPLVNNRLAPYLLPDITQWTSLSSVAWMVFQVVFHSNLKCIFSQTLSWIACQ